MNIEKNCFINRLSTFFALGVLLLCFHPIGYAQDTKLYKPQLIHPISGDLFEYDVKQYSIEMSPVPMSTGDHALAGTIYHEEVGRTSVHFLKVNASGAYSVDKMYDMNPNTDTPYYYRAVDIAARREGAANRFFITCQGLYYPPTGTATVAQAGPPTGYTGQPFKDRTRIMILDDNGDPVDDDGDLIQDVVDFEDFTVVGGYQYAGDHMYPLNSLYHQDVGGTFKRLYVCGYLNKNYSAYNNEIFGPQSKDAKEAFVFCVDVDPASPNYLQVIAAESFNWDNTNPPPNPLPQFERDYDIAMRMRIIKAPSGVTQYTDQLFVTGSVNALTSTPPTPNIYRSGSMCIVLDAANLALLTDVSFIQAPYDAAFEYGIDLVEDVSGTPSNNSFYIVGNTFSDQTYRYPKMGITTDLYGESVYIIRVDPWNFQSNFVRQELKDFWAQSVMPSLIPTSKGFGYHRFALAGMTANRYGTFTHLGIPAPQAHDSNLLSVVTDVEFVPGNVPNTVYMDNPVIYPTSHGTGDPQTDANSYYALGWGVSNHVWNPVSAVRDQNNLNNVYMTTPRIDGSNNRLNFKWMQFISPTAPGGTYNPGLGGATDCPKFEFLTRYFEPVDVELAGITCGPRTLTIVRFFPGLADTIISTEVNICDQPNQFKPTSVIEQRTTGKISLYPNPAYDELKIAGIEAAGYRVMDITGREVKSGNITQAKNIIDVKDLGIGVYILELTEAQRQTTHKFVKE